jgi:succinate dehydrogenase / fumarate reductase, cytochrome b subunit
MDQIQQNGINRSYWFGKLFSIFGLIPIGLYVIVHLYNNLTSLYGEEAFNKHLFDSRTTPLIIPLAILVIWIPIAFHGIYGLVMMKKARPNLVRFAYFQNLKYVLQRLSGIGLLLFIPAHIYKTRIEPGFFNSALNFHHMSEGLHEPLTLTVYIFGVLGVAFHLANGLWQFCIGWGITVREKAMRRVEIFSMVFFLVLLAMGYGAIWGFLRTG